MTEDLQVAVKVVETKISDINDRFLDMKGQIEKLDGKVDSNMIETRNLLDNHSKESKESLKEITSLLTKIDEKHTKATNKLSIKLAAMVTSASIFFGLIGNYISNIFTHQK